MGQCRDLLPVNLLPEFREWLEGQDIEVRDSTSLYSAYSVRMDGKGYDVYVRAQTSAGNKTVHASIYGPVIGLARQFLTERKASK